MYVEMWRKETLLYCYWECKGAATMENRMEVPKETKTTIHTRAYIQRKPYQEKVNADQCSLQHYLQQPGHGSNLDVNLER